MKVGDRGIIRGEIISSGLFGGDTTYKVSADFTVAEVLGRSVRIYVGEVYGLPRRERKEARELLEGWHREADLLPRASQPKVERAT